MSLNPIPPVDRVLHVPELLDMIFGYLDHKSNIVNACVSKQWSPIALDKVWRNVDDISRLFALLAPLEPMSPGIYPNPSQKPKFKFSRTPTAQDWDIFLKYARRVRSLVYDDFYKDSEKSTLDHSVFDTIARTRTTLDILPHNKSLFWKSDPSYLQYCVLFLHPNLAELQLSLLPPRFEGSETTEDYKGVFEDVLARSPNLRVVDLRTWKVQPRVVQPLLVDWLPKLSRLRKVVFPQYYITSVIAQAVSQLEELQCLEFQYYPTHGKGAISDVRPFNPELTEGAFPVLGDVSLTTSFIDMSRFLEMRFAPQKLTMIFIESFQIEQPADFDYVIAAVVDQCPLVRQLCLLSEVDALDVVSPPALSESITYAHIQGVLALPQLRHLELHHQYPLSITQEEVEEFSSKLPKGMEVLIFNCEPAYIQESTLTLRALLPFAEHCTKLKQLALFINASEADIPIPTPPADPFPPFRNLTRFWAGTSLIAPSSSGAIALFLSHLFPSSSIQIDSGITWTEDETRVLEPGLWNEIQDRCASWKKVQEMLPLLVKLRLEDRMRSRELITEVDDLRMRTDVLMGEKQGGVKRVDGCVVS